MNPYKPVDIGDVLTRKYLVSQFSWAPGDAFGTNLEKLDFPAALYAIPNIADKLAHFRWLNSDVTLEVRLNTSPLHMGALGVSWLPHYAMPDNPGFPTANVVQRLQNNAHILSASSRQSITFDMIRTAPRLADPAHTNPLSQIGRLWIDVLNPLKISGTGTPATVNVSVFASFKNPVVSGYGYTAPTALNVKRRVVELAAKERAHKQSKKTPQKEGEAKAKGGVISGVLEAAGNFTPILAATPFAEFAPFTAIAGVLAPFVRSLGFSKPMDPSKITRATINDFAEFPYGHGLTPGTKLALHPEATVGDAKNAQLKRHSIQELIKRPVLLYNGSITSATAALATILRFAVQPSLAYKLATDAYQPGMMAYLSQMFSTWRGGLKFKIQFITGQFTTARVRITHNPNYEAIPSVEEYAGDAVSAVVDIRGDTEFEFTIPYINPMPYLPVLRLYGVTEDISTMLPNPWDSSYVTISVINPSTVSVVGGDSTIGINIWVAAADDFEFGHLGNFNVRNNLLDPPARKQSLEQAFSKSFDPLSAGYASSEIGLVLPEKYSSIEAILKRPSICEDYIEGYQVNPMYFATSAPVGSVFTALTQLFLFWRGAMRVTVCYKQALNAVVAVGSKIETRLIDDELMEMSFSRRAFVDPSKSRTTTIEYPYTSLSYMKHNWIVNENAFPEDRDIDLYTDAILDAEIEHIWISVGEDFTWSVVLPPPPLSTAPAVEGKNKKETFDLSVSSQMRELVKVPTK